MSDNKKITAAAVLVLMIASLTAYQGWKSPSGHNPLSPKMAGIEMPLSEPPPVAPQVEPEPVPEAPKLVVPVRKKKKHAMRAPKRLRVASTATAVPMGTSEAVAMPRSSRKWGRVEAGIDGADQFLLPTVRFQAVLSNAVTLGVHFSAIKNAFGNTGSAWGGGVTGAYYFSQTPFRGLLVDAGAALYHMEGSNRFSASAASPIVLSSTVGWTGSMGANLTLSANAGLQYAHNQGRNIGYIKFDGLRPLVKLGVGYEF